MTDELGPVDNRLPHEWPEARPILDRVIAGLGVSSARRILDYVNLQAAINARFDRVDKEIHDGNGDAELLRILNTRVDEISISLGAQQVEIERVDATLGHIVSKQIEDGKVLQKLSAFDAAFLREVQNIRAENANWATTWFASLTEINVRLSKGNYFMVALVGAVCLLCVVGIIAIFQR